MGRRRIPPILEADDFRRERDEPRERDRPIEVEITDVLDLHSFRPSEVADLVETYLGEAIARGLYEVRIIHGRGTGALRRTVRAVLERHPKVSGYDDAPPHLGGWGATSVSLRD